ncbi:MAG: TetR family transcriptional regulator [Rhizomicrobium sp.]
MSELSADPKDVDHWKKDATRQAILAAARRLSAREGIDAVTLGRVAVEAGFAATVVYTYFVTKDDLHLALVADDLETIAEVMRDGTGEEIAPTLEAEDQQPSASMPISGSDFAALAPSGPPTSSPRGPQSLVELEQALGVVRQATDEFLADPGSDLEPIPDAFPEETVQEVEASVSALGEVRPREMEPRVEWQGNTEEAGRVGPHDIADSIVQLQSRIHRLERGTVHGELVRRLDSLEKGLAVLEGRIDRLGQEVEEAQAKFEENQSRLTNQMAEALGTSHRSLLERNEQHALVVADLRIYVKELTGRIGAVENWLARTARIPTAAEDQRAQSLRSEEAHTQGASSIAASHDRSPKNRQPKRSVGRRTLRLPRKRWLVALSLIAVLAIGVVGVLIDLHLLPPGFGPTSQVATVPARTTVDARIVAMAKAGSANAELVVGLKLLNGDGTATDIPGAAYWLRQAALQNQPVADYWLGTLYERGQGLPQNRALAQQWYAKAAAAGNAKAMYRLGVGYAEGWGGTPDLTSAAKWFAAAAQYGVVDAQFNLAVLYERGSGVALSLKNAFMWYSIAAAQGDAQSKARLDMLAAHMSSADVAAAQAAASTFKALQPPTAANVVPDPAELAARL